MKLTRETIETFEYTEPEIMEQIDEKTSSLLSVDLFGQTWEVRPFALCVAGAVLLALVLLWMTARRSGLKKGTPATLPLLLLPLGLVFSHVFYVLGSWNWYEAIGLKHALYLWEGGYAMWGAILGCVLAVLLTSLVTKERPAVLFDACAAPMALFITLFRFVSYPVSGENQGIMLTSETFLCRFPFAMQNDGEWYCSVFLLEGFIALVILLVVLFSRRKNGDKAKLFLILYSAAQILCDRLHLNEAGKMIWHEFVRIPMLVSAIVPVVLFIVSVIRRGRKSAPACLSGRRITELALVIVHSVALIIAMEFAIEKLRVFPVWIHYVISADCCFLFGYAVYQGVLPTLCQSDERSGKRIAELVILLVHGIALAIGALLFMLTIINQELSIFPIWACCAIIADACLIVGYAVFRLVSDARNRTAKGA